MDLLGHLAYATLFIIRDCQTYMLLHYVRACARPTRRTF